MNKNKIRNLKKEKLFPFLCLLPFVALIFAFQILPLLKIVDNSFRDNATNSYSLFQYIQIFKSNFFIQSIKNSLEISVYSTIFGLLIALQGAYSITKLNKKIKEKVILLSNMTSNFAGVPLAFAFIILLGFNGSFTVLLKDIGVIKEFNLYSKFGLIIVYTYFQIPLGMLLIYPSFDGIKNEWFEASNILGASKLQYWLKIALPILTPSILGTGIILFANSMGAYATAYALTSGNFNILPIRVSSLVAGDLFLNPNLASALSIILSLILIFIITLDKLLLKKKFSKKE